MKARYWVIAAVVAFALLVAYRWTRPVTVSPYYPGQFLSSECSSEAVTDPNAGPGIKTTCTHIDWRRDTEARPADQYDTEDPNYP
jgi:hypothetical protein